MDLPLTLADYAARASEMLDPGTFAYYAGGAEDEETLRDNVAAWRRWGLRTRVLVDVSEVDESAEILGRRRAHPLIVAPMAYHRLAHPDAEVATARGAAATRTPLCLSTLATTSPADLAAGAPEADRWLQVYVFKDRGVTRELVSSAAEHGFEALVLTVDLPVLGKRERDLRLGFAVGNAAAIPAAGRAGARGMLTLAHTAELIDPSLTWDVVGWLAAESGLPVLVKGVLEADDARRAVAAGAAGVVVSNHGGRQLDGALASADALPAIADAVGGDLDVLVDGGIRRGSDVVRALALGARGVLIGRPVLHGLAVAGDAGVRAVLEILLDELARSLQLAGRPRAADVGPDAIARR